MAKTVSDLGLSQKQSKAIDSSRRVVADRERALRIKQKQTKAKQSESNRVEPNRGQRGDQLDRRTDQDGIILCTLAKYLAAAAAVSSTAAAAATEYQKRNDVTRKPQ